MEKKVLAFTGNKKNEVYSLFVLLFQEPPDVSGHHFQG